MGVLDNLAKYFLFITNLLIFILSWAILALGIWALVNRNTFLDLLDEANVDVPIYESAVILFLFVASCTIIISCLGCCGAYKESKCMLISYFVFVLGLLILIVVGTIVGMAQGTSKLADPFLDSLSTYDETRQTVVEITWDQTQKDLECCGVHSPADWVKYNERYSYRNSFIDQGDHGLIGAKVPPSCCASSSSPTLCQINPTGHMGAFQQGCWSLVEAEIIEHVDSLGGVAITIIVILTLNMVIAFYMCACGLDSDIDSRPKKQGYGRPGGRA